MTPSTACFKLIKEFEGLRLTAYRDAVGVLTIGYGHTGSDVRPRQKISKERADELLSRDVAAAARDVLDFVKVPLTQGQFDALTSFVFNLGASNFLHSTLRRKLNARDYAGAAEEFDRWTKGDVNGDGKTESHENLRGLVVRRAAEKALFLYR